MIFAVYWDGFGVYDAVRNCDELFGSLSDGLVLNVLKFIIYLVKFKYFEEDFIQKLSLVINN